MTRSTQQRKQAFEAKITFIRPASQGAWATKPEERPISLPSICGMTYAYQGDRLIVNGFAQPARER